MDTLSPDGRIHLQTFGRPSISTLSPTFSATSIHGESDWVLRSSDPGVVETNFGSANLPPSVSQVGPVAAV